MRGGLLALCLLAAPAFGADEVRVVSPQPDSVSITIYRDFLALITETRTVDLPAGPVTLEFDGVVETLIPQSAVIADTGRGVDESNYDFERLSPETLLRYSIGKTVTLTRTNRATGKASQVAATVISANSGGVVFRTGDGNEALHCSGLPERLTFNEIPAGLNLKPTLSIHLAAGTPGKRQVRVSYIAQGFGWAADYVAQVDRTANRMDLRGWLTLRNFTGARFADAQVQVVAGRLNLLDAEERGSSTIGDTAEFVNEEDQERARKERLEALQEDDGEPDDLDYFYGCYPYGPAIFPPGPHPRREAAGIVDSIFARGSEELEEVIVTGFRGSLVERENLADYQMYRMPWKTDLGARQTKQVAFLYKPDVTIDSFYGARFASGSRDDEDIDEIMNLKIRIGWNNRKSDGLGEPLPGGIVRVFENDNDRQVFEGEDTIEDTPVGVPSEITIGSSPDLVVATNLDTDEPQVNLLSLLTRRGSIPFDMRITNARARAVTVEIRQGNIQDYEDLRVVGASLRPTRKAGDYAWRFTIPANGEQELHYKVSVRVPRYD